MAWGSQSLEKFLAIEVGGGKKDAENTSTSSTLDIAKALELSVEILNVGIQCALE